MPAISTAVSLLPGHFNSAAIQHLHTIGRMMSDAAPTGDNWDGGDKPIDDATARIVFGSNLSIMLDPELYKTVVVSNLSVTDTFDRTFEVCSIAFADDVARLRYKSTSQHLVRTIGTELETCGTIFLRPTIVFDGWDNTSSATLSAVATERFFLEESILEHFKVGMTITMTICLTNAGLTFIKEVKRVNPTFYLFLPQQLMLKFREPTLNPRPAPSVHNPDAEEDVLESVFVGDLDD